MSGSEFDMYVIYAVNSTKKRDAFQFQRSHYWNRKSGRRVMTLPGRIRGSILLATRPNATRVSYEIAIMSWYVNRFLCNACPISHHYISDGPGRGIAFYAPHSGELRNHSRRRNRESN